MGGDVADDGLFGVDRRLRIDGVGTEGEEEEKADGNRNTQDVGTPAIAGATALKAHRMRGGKGSDMSKVGRREGL